MPTIIVCCKWVIDEAYLRWDAAGTLDRSMVDWKLSDYDRHALEEAVKLREEQGGNVTVVMVGDEGTTKGMKDALSRGADNGYLVTDPSFAELDPAQTAAIIAATLKERLSSYDLILCGEGSSDLYARQVGPRLGASLRIPCLTAVRKLVVEGKEIVVERSLEREIEVIRSPFPAVVTVLPEINSPRIPGVKDTLGAARKPLVKLGKDDVPPIGVSSFIKVTVRKAQIERDCVMLENTPEGMAQLIEGLKKKGVLTDYGR